MPKARPVSSGWTDEAAFRVPPFAVGFITLQPKHPVSGFLLSALWVLACSFLSCALPTKMISDALSIVFLLLKSQLYHAFMFA